MLRHVIEIYDLLSDPSARGPQVAALFDGSRTALTETADDAGRHVDFIKIVFPGSAGKMSGGSAPTLGILGTLGGLRIPGLSKGLVSDADGAVVALACALRLEQMSGFGERYKGDVIVATHVCQEAIEEPHEPYSFMRGPLSKRDMTAPQVDPDMDAILSIDTSRGNRVWQPRWLRHHVSGQRGLGAEGESRLAARHGIHDGPGARGLPDRHAGHHPLRKRTHPHQRDHAAGDLDRGARRRVALTTRAVVPGIGTGVAHLTHLEVAGRFCLGTAEAFGAGDCTFYDAAEFARLVELYGSMGHLQGT